MDKNTLSNYGWIVIAVLVLSVMIALATPFGKYIKDAVWSTTEGLFDVQNNALDIIGATTNSTPNQSSIDFHPKNIYDDSLYVDGLGAKLSSNQKEYISVMNDPSTTNQHSIVLPLEHGKCYEIKFPVVPERLCAGVLDSDPRQLQIGEESETGTLLIFDTAPTEETAQPLFYVPQKSGEYLVIYTGWSSLTPVSIIEHTIVAETDTSGPWYTSPLVADIMGNADSFGNYNWKSEEFINNLYEPMRSANPDYITRTNIGKDESGQFNMYSYVFEPEEYEQTVFLTSGMHGNEEEAYFALANFMQQVCNEDGSNSQLHYLRTKVKFVVIPLINVWGVNKTHSMEINYNLRYNSTGADLNRDFADKTQQETKNVMAEFEKYKDEITFAIDFHTSVDDVDIALYYNFPIVAENTECNFKTANHMYHTFLNKGYVTELSKLLTPTDSTSATAAAVTGSYVGSKTLQGNIWNNYKIPAMTIEYTPYGNFPPKFSSEAITIAVEAYGNFIIQNALYFKP